METRSRYIRCFFLISSITHRKNYAPYEAITLDILSPPTNLPYASGVDNALSLVLLSCGLLLTSRQSQCNSVMYSYFYILQELFSFLLDILQFINCRSYLAFLVIYKYMFLYLVYCMCIYT